jgi:hypothetical protein
MEMIIEATDNVTTSQIIGAAIEVHRILGPGLLESTYTECLKLEFDDRTVLRRFSVDSVSSAAQEQECGPIFSLRISRR